jgi:serine/threonine-protein kinase
VRSPQASSPEPLQFPSPTPGNNNQTSSLGKSIPGFAPGTQRQAVEVELGNPTKVSKGVWPNTRAVLYEEFVPNQVSLGYLFDRNSGRLRQTEASFAQSVELKTMSQTLEKMLNGNASADIQQGLQAVYQGKSNRYKFASGRENRLKGVIERNERDRIYIAVWEADLH